MIETDFSPLDDELSMIQKVASMGQIIENLEAKVKQLEADNFALSAGQCVDKRGIIGADNGDPLCPLIAFSDPVYPLRDYFAAKAMGGLVSGIDSKEIYGKMRDLPSGWIAKKAYQQADAMLAVLTGTAK